MMLLVVGMVLTFVLGIASGWLMALFALRRVVIRNLGGKKDEL